MLVDVSNLVGPHHSFPRSGKKMMDIFPSCAVPWVKPARPQLGFCDKDLWFEGTRTANPCFFLGGTMFHHFPEATVDFSIDLSWFDLELEHLETDPFVPWHLAGGVPLCRRVRRRRSAAACQEPRSRRKRIEHLVQEGPDGAPISISRFHEF
jgi:hypothetical protein